MQKAIENYIKAQSKNLVPLEKVNDEINRVVKSEIKAARQRQLRQWRKLPKINLKGGIKS